MRPRPPTLVVATSVLVAGLAACSGGDDAAEGTAVRLRLLFSARVVLTQAEVTLGDLQFTAPSAPARLDSPADLMVRLDDSVAGAVQQVEVWGLASGVRVAHGRAAVLPIAGAVAEVDVPLVRLDCGHGCDPGARDCAGPVPRVCDLTVDGCSRWSPGAACADATPWCVRGACVAEPGAEGGAGEGEGEGVQGAEGEGEGEGAVEPEPEPEPDPDAGPGPDPEPVRAALWFDGEDDVAWAEVQGGLPRVDGLTVEVQVLVDRPAPGVIVVSAGDPEAGDGPFELGFDDDRFRPFVRTGHAEGRVALECGPVPPGRWTHVAVTYDGATVRGWVDGEMACEEPLDGVPIQDADRLWVGSVPGRRPYAGFLDELRIWDRALDEGELARLRDGPPDPSWPGLLARWDMTRVDGGKVPPSEATPAAPALVLGRSSEVGADDPKQSVGEGPY